MGVPPARAQGALRMTLGYTTSESDVDRAIDVVAASVTQLRRLFVG
jgi:cysteine sulfinate desulfinase/cysteine desulfurase-like protein